MPRFAIFPDRGRHRRPARRGRGDERRQRHDQRRQNRPAHRRRAHRPGFDPRPDLSHRTDHRQGGRGLQERHPDRDL
ncbi:MAG: hypothetical protein MZV70_49390 [Desulfobacterales bacterium]|nr:hypothetical protein [Desulfobacterales bacterium]